MIILKQDLQNWNQFWKISYSEAGIAIRVDFDHLGHEIYAGMDFWME